MSQCTGVTSPWGYEPKQPIVQVQNGPRSHMAVYCSQFCNWTISHNDDDDDDKAAQSFIKIDPHNFCPLFQLWLHLWAVLVRTPFWMKPWAALDILKIYGPFLSEPSWYKPSPCLTVSVPHLVLEVHSRASGIMRFPLPKIFCGSRYCLTALSKPRPGDEMVRSRNCFLIFPTVATFNNNNSMV